LKEPPIASTTALHALPNTLQERPGATAWDVCMALKHNGMLAKPTHGNIIRLAPPLTMSDAQLEECVAILKKTLMSFVQ